MTSQVTHHKIVNDEQFAALCNLFHTIICEKAELSPAEIGDIVYYGANRVVCDESRDMARAVMAYLGLRFAGGQPRHEPGSGCRFADEQRQLRLPRSWPRRRTRGRHGERDAGRRRRALLLRRPRLTGHHTGRAAPQWRSQHPPTRFRHGPRSTKASGCARG